MKLGCDSVLLCSAHYWLSVEYCINPRVHLHFTFTHRLDTVCWPSCMDFTAVVIFGCLMFLWYVLTFVMLIVDKANRRSHWLQAAVKFQAWWVSVLLIDDDKYQSWQYGASCDQSYNRTRNSRPWMYLSYWMTPVSATLSDVNFTVSAPILNSKLPEPLPYLLFTLSVITASLYTASYQNLKQIVFRLFRTLLPGLWLRPQILSRHPYSQISTLA